MEGTFGAMYGPFEIFGLNNMDPVIFRKFIYTVSVTTGTSA